VDRSEDVPFSVPPGLRIAMKRSDKPLSDMLADGDLPAMISPTLPRPFVEGDKRIARLFADYKQIEIDYFRQTGIFPIMHVTTVKREIVEKYPWVPTNLVKAFEQAKQIAYRRVANPRMIPLAWVRTAVEEQERASSAGDPWEFGLDLNKRFDADQLLHDQIRPDRGRLEICSPKVVRYPTPLPNFQPINIRGRGKVERVTSCHRPTRRPERRGGEIQPRKDGSGLRCTARAASRPG
jgi:hypothetical protein